MSPTRPSRRYLLPASALVVAVVAAVAVQLVGGHGADGSGAALPAAPRAGAAGFADGSELSATSRTVPEGDGVSLPSVIQTSAPINPGNSGGALVDATGSVIGIPTLAAIDPEMGVAADGIGFAISGNTVRSIASQLVAHGRVLHSGRAWLDVDLRTVEGVGVGVGVVVASAAANGPAGRAGIRAGDVIVRLTGRPTPSVDEFADALAAERPGRRVRIDVRRSGRVRGATVRLGELPPGG